MRPAASATADAVASNSERVVTQFAGSLERKSSESSGPAPAFEGFAKRRFGLVADAIGDFGEGGGPLAQESGGFLHSPSCDVVKWGFPYELGETAGKSRSRHADFRGQRGDRPRVFGILVDQRKRGSALSVGQRPQPAALSFGSGNQEATHDLNEPDGG